MCLKHATEKELLDEISERIDEKKITWELSYLYEEDKTRLSLHSLAENHTLSFIQESEIEKSFFARQVYKRLELSLINAKKRKKQADKLS